MADLKAARAAAEVEKQKAVTAAEQARDVAVLAAEARKTVASEDALAASEEKRANILRGEGEAARKKLVMAADGALQQNVQNTPTRSKHAAVRLQFSGQQSRNG